MLVAAFAPVAAESVAAAGHAPPAQNRTTPRLASQAKSDTLAERFETAPIRTLGAKEHLFCEGDPASHVYRVEAGHVVLYRTMPDGRRQVIDFAYPGDVIGLGALATHGHNAQATGTAVLRCLPVALLQALAGCDPRLGLKLYEAVSRELIAARELLFTVSQRTATERLASFLLALSRRSARRGGSPREIVLPMTRSDIADFLGLTIETVSRTFTRLRAEGLIEIEQCILVTIKDEAALEATALADAGRRH